MHYSQLISSKTYYQILTSGKIIRIVLSKLGHSMSTQPILTKVPVSNIAQKIPKIALVSIMKACKILGCNSEYFSRYSLSNFLFYYAVLHSRLKWLPIIPTCYTCPASRFVMSLAVGMQGQKAYGLCTIPLCAVLVVQFFP